MKPLPIIEKEDEIYFEYSHCYASINSIEIERY